MNPFIQNLIYKFIFWQRTILHFINQGYIGCTGAFSQTVLIEIPKKQYKIHQPDKNQSNHRSTPKTQSQQANRLNRGPVHITFLWNIQKVFLENTFLKGFKCNSLDNTGFVKKCNSNVSRFGLLMIICRKLPGILSYSEAKKGDSLEGNFYFWQLP